MPMDIFRMTGDGFDNTDSIFTALKKYNLVIASVHSNDIRSSLQYGINDCLIDLVDSLSARQEVILDLFANPYILNRFRHLDRLRAVVVSFENSPLAQELSAQLIFGALGASGTMPVTAGLWKSMASGLPVTGIGRLQFNLPLAAGMNEDTLLLIDGIVSEAIEKQAIPGCQVLVARKGAVVLNKAFGNHMYGNGKPVSVTDLYDLASVTKVVATTCGSHETY